MLRVQKFINLYKLNFSWILELQKEALYHCLLLKFFKIYCESDSPCKNYGVQFSAGN